jgi:hypothetical protein
MVFENGTLFARYAAERELVQRFVAVFPAESSKADSASLARAEAHVRATRPAVPYALLRANSPAVAGREVLAALAPLASMLPTA